MSDFSPESKALFGAARAGLEPSAGDRARIQRALGARLGVAVVAASASVSATAGAAGSAVGTASTLAVVVKWLGVGLLVGVGAASGYVVVRGGGAASKAPSLASAAAAASLASPVQAPPARVAIAPSDDAAPLVAEPGVAPGMPPAVSVEPREKTTAAASPVPPQPSAHVGEEAALLRRADEALRAGDASRALTLLRDHALHFPGGILAEERSAELVTTLCRLGRTPEARREAEQFLRANPDSPLAASVRSSCAGLEGAEAR